MPKTVRSSATNQGQYSDPPLRERLKQKIMDGAKGGRAGQWSALKAQLLASEYKRAGGGYTRPRTESQKSLQKWTDEEWTTSDGTKAVRGKTTTRYLPKKAWQKLSPNQKAATNKKKAAATKKRKQFVANTKAAADARRSVSVKRAKKVVRKSAKRAARKKPKS